MKKKQQIPDLPKSSLLSQLSFNIKELVDKQFFNDICVPKGTEILLSFKVEVFPIIIKDKNFELKIEHDIFHYGTHLESRHSSFYNLLERSSNLYNSKFLFVSLNCVYEANFTFPEEYDELFNYYIDYAKNVKTLLKNEWDFNFFLEKLPHPILFSIDKKLDKLLKTKKL